MTFHQVFLFLLYRAMLFDVIPCHAMSDVTGEDLGDEYHGNNKGTHFG